VLAHGGRRRTVAIPLLAVGRAQMDTVLTLAREALPEESAASRSRAAHARAIAQRGARV
jgi:hypothetical protein